MSDTDRALTHSGERAKGCGRMLCFHVRGSDLSTPWKADRDGWSAGSSYIKPFKHPALEHFSITAAERVLIVVRERLAGIDRVASQQPCGGIDVVDTEKFLDECDAVPKWPLDFVAVELSLRADSPAVEFRAGLWGSAPLHLVAGNCEVWGHWDPAELYQHLTSDQLSAEYAARFLINCDQPYSRRTMFPEIYRLTERARAHWQPKNGKNSLTFEYPHNARLPTSRTLKPGADVVAGFLEIVTASTQRRLGVPTKSWSAELSGGLDSAIVAGVAARSSPEPIRSFGLIMLGEAGIEQQQRRSELVDLFNFEDHHLDVGDHFLFSPAGSRIASGRVVPWEEVFIEASEALLALARERGSLISFNGTGGDELCSRQWLEMTTDEQAQRRQEVIGYPPDLPPFLSRRASEAIKDSESTMDWAPVSPLFTSSLDAAAAISNLFLRHGVWPVSPLCTPELVAFSRCLPLEWRENRRIEREVLLRMGCSRNIAYPTSTEDFGPVLDLSVRVASRPLFVQLFRESRLAELGLVDADRLRSTYDRHCEGQGGYDSTPFYAAAVLEMTLRSVTMMRGRS